MALCIICGTTDENDFADTRDDLCERCKDIMDYWFREALNDVRTISSVKGKELSSMDFADAVEIYGNMKWREEYDRNQNREKRQHTAYGV